MTFLWGVGGVGGGLVCGERCSSPGLPEIWASVRGMSHGQITGDIRVRMCSSSLIRIFIELHLNCVYCSVIYDINLILCVMHKPFSEVVVLCWSIGDSEIHIAPNTNAIIQWRDLRNPTMPPPKSDENTYTRWHIVFAITATRKLYFTNACVKKAVSVTQYAQLKWSEYLHRHCLDGGSFFRVDRTPK